MSFERASLLVWLAGVTLTTGALADEPDGAADQARQEFVLGASLARRGEWPEALAAFERSAVRRAHPVTTYNIGYCERSLGHYTRARKRLTQALREDTEARNGTMPAAMREHAEAYIGEAERRLARVIVTLAGADTAVAVDGRPLEDAGRRPGIPLMIAGTRDPGRAEPPPAPTFELWADPGEHVVVVSRAGAADIVSSHQFAAGSTLTLRLIASDPIAPDSRPASSDPPRPAHSRDMTWPVLAFGLGAAGLTVFALAGVATLRTKARLDEVCGSDGQTCPPGTEADQRAVSTYAAVSTVGLGVAVAGGLAGTILLLVADKPRPPAVDRSAGRSGRSLDRWLGPAGLGARARF